MSRQSRATKQQSATVAVLRKNNLGPYCPAQFPFARESTTYLSDVQCAAHVRPLYSFGYKHSAMAKLEPTARPRCMYKPTVFRGLSRERYFYRRRHRRTGGLADRQTPSLISLLTLIQETNTVGSTKSGLVPIYRCTVLFR